MEAGIWLWVEEASLSPALEGLQSLWQQGKGYPTARMHCLWGQKAAGLLLGSWKRGLTHQTLHTALTCSTSPREPAGPLPTGAAGIARPGGSRPRAAAAIGSPVDGSVVNRCGSEGPNMGGPGQAFFRYNEPCPPHLWGISSQHHSQGLRGSLSKAQLAWHRQGQHTPVCATRSTKLLMTDIQAQEVAQGWPLQ